MKELPFFSFPSHRIEKIALDVSDRSFNVFCVYAPTTVDNHEVECRTFYDELSSLVNDIPLRDHILICGYLNAPFTADGCRVKNVFGELSSKSEAMQTFINHYDVIAANGIIRQKTKQVADHRRPEGEMYALRLDIRLE